MIQSHILTRVYFVKLGIVQRIRARRVTNSALGKIEFHFVLYQSKICWDSCVEDEIGRKSK